MKKLCVRIITIKFWVMKKERYNVYERAHGKLRSQLLDAGLVVQCTSFEKTGKANLAFIKIEEVGGAINQYLVQSNKILESVFSFAPYIIMEAEKDKTSIKTLVSKTMDVKDQYSKALTQSLKKKLGVAAQQLFFELTAAMLRMMNREEVIINDLLWSVFTEQEVAELKKKVTTPVIEIDPVLQSENIKNEIVVSSAATKEAKPLLSFENFLPISEKFSDLVRSVIAPEKWSFANRFYNISRPCNLFGLIIITVLCTITPIIAPV